MVGPVRFWLVRHAPIKREARGTIVGRTDVSAELPIAGRLTRAVLPDRALWVASPALRARQTADALGASELRLEPDLLEQDFGVWEGATWDRLLAEEPHAAAFLAAYDRLQPPGGESLDQVRLRAWAALERIAAVAETPDVVLVIHSGPIRCLLAEILGIPLNQALKLSVDHLSVSPIEGGPWGWQVRGINWAGGLLERGQTIAETTV